MLGGGGGGGGGTYRLQTLYMTRAFGKGGDLPLRSSSHHKDLWKGFCLGASFNNLVPLRFEYQHSEPWALKNLLHTAYHYSVACGNPGST